jgi:hypothetical protein
LLADQQYAQGHGARGGLNGGGQSVVPLSYHRCREAQALAREK